MRAPFFSHKNLLLLVVAALAIYLLVVASFVVQYEIAHRRRVHDQKVAMDKYNHLSPAEKAIRKGEVYQAGIITSAQPAVRLLYDYLQRSYNLRPELGVLGSPFSIPQNGSVGYPEELSYMARIAFPEQVVASAPRSDLQSVSMTNVYSVNCDHIALPTSFWQTMQQNYGQGGYYVTHTALALRFMQDNGCIIPAAGMALQDKVPAQMASIADDPKGTPDLRYEAITMLELTGHRDLVQQDWIDQIIADQKGDGSWSSNGSTNDHVTLLALWALLQYSRPEVQYQPLIRHISQ